MHRKIFWKHLWRKYWWLSHPRRCHTGD
jgi:hypothetical protein